MSAPVETTVTVNGHACRVLAKGTGPKLGFLAGLIGVPKWTPFLDALATRGPLPTVSCVAFGDAAEIALAFANLDARVARAAAIGSPRTLPLDLGANPAKPLAWMARPGDLVSAR